ncbi:MAG: glycoside hydrolase family 3 C-terminal domain-containing protein [Bacteroidales bacterium]|nr:glycoside hydrolase family 3 C-terminal domain-containing protein [Bacteroidales bacterium]
MKKQLTVIAMAALALVSCGPKNSSQVAPAIAKDAEIEKNVEKWIDKLTLDEKIGQMLELNLDLMGSMKAQGEVKIDRNKLKQVLAQYGTKPEMIEGILKQSDEEIDAQMGNYGLDIYEGSVNREWTLNEELLDSLIGTWKIGSILNAPGHALSVEKWQTIIPKIQELSMKHIGIPCIYGLDNNHGVTYVAGGTLFPQSINVAASFNTKLAYESSEICAYESRAAKCPWVYNPTIDLGRDPRWSRIWESYGEDAIVTSRMVEAAVRGYQGEDNNHIDGNHVATSVKHYFCYGAPWSGKDRTPAYVSPQMLREKYFAPFKAAIQAGAMTIMVNSASINGVPVHASYEYLTKWLKEDLNWDGMIITDWADINNLYTREKVAKDKKDAIRIAINAGIDMSMDPYSTDFCVLLKELVEEGQVPMSRIDDAVRRIIRLKYRLGLFENPNTTAEAHPNFACAEYAEKSLRAAEETEVLLKNDGVLPIAKGKRILVTGPNANQIRCLNGGWSYTWQGSKSEAFTEQYNTIYEALSNKYGAQNVILEQGVTYNENGSWWDENEPQIGKAVAAAGRADIIVACIGENSYCETPGNLTDLTLSTNQRNLVKALAQTGKPVVLVINGGRPRLIADIEPLAKGIIDIFLPGNYGADALANLIAGDVNFSAKMPYTYPKEINSLINYDYKVSEQVSTMAGAYDYDAKVTQQWAFGYGLSYTTYSYANLKAEKSEFKAGEELKFTVDVTNTGNVAGKEAVLLYSSDLLASVVPDSRRLRAFEKVELQPGETKTVSFSIPASDLAFVGADGKWVLEEGEFVITAGGQAVTIKATETKKWETPNI